MPDWFSKLFTFLKLGTSSILALLLASGFILFADPSWVQRMGLNVLRQDYKSWIGLTLLLSVSLLLSRACISVGSATAGVWRKRQESRQIRKRLHALTQHEIDVLALYISGQTRTHNLDVTNGPVAALRSVSIIRVCSSYGNVVDGWPCEIHEEAWVYLNLHPELLRLRHGRTTDIPNELLDAPN